MAKERVTWQNTNFRVIDGEGKSSDTDMADRVMKEIGDSFPFKIIEGTKTEKTSNKIKKNLKKAIKMSDSKPLINPLKVDEIPVGQYSDFVRLLEEKKKEESEINNPNTTSGSFDK